MTASPPTPTPIPIPVPAPAPNPSGPRQPNKLRKKVSFAASAKSAHSGTSATSKTDGGVSEDEGAEGSRGMDEAFKSPAQKTAAWLAGLSFGGGGGGMGTGKNKQLDKNAGATGEVTMDPGTSDAAPNASVGGNDIHGLSVDTSQDEVQDAHKGNAAPTWKHHERYFPLFSESDIFPSSPAGPTTTLSKSGLTTTGTSTTTTAPSSSGYTFTSPFQDALTIVEAQALEHAKLSNRNVVLHYPALPSFDEFLQGKSRESVGWQDPQWGTSGWTGYGWAGEALPGSQGRTFGAPMPDALGIGPEGEVVQKKEEKKEAAPAEGGGGGGGGGGGEVAGKKKKKK